MKDSEIDELSKIDGVPYLGVGAVVRVFMPNKGRKSWQFWKSKYTSVKLASPVLGYNDILETDKAFYEWYDISGWKRLSCLVEKK